MPKNSVAGIVQTENEKINTHNHIDAFDLHGSLDVSCLYCVHSGEKETSVTFDYNDGRRKGGVGECVKDRTIYIVRFRFKPLYW